MPIKIISLLLLLTAPATWATTVSTGKSDYATTTHTSCVPNVGGVTIGNYEVMGVQAASTHTASIASTRVPVWTLAQLADPGGAIQYYYWYGPATSSGAETITVTLADGATGNIGSACGEYTTHFNVTAAGAYFDQYPLTAIIAVGAGSDLVAWTTSNTGGPTISAPYITEQSIKDGGTTYTILADYVAPSAGSYTVPSGVLSSPVFVVGFCCSGSRHKSQIIRYHPPRNRSIIRTGGK